MAKISYTKKVGVRPTLPFILVFLGGILALVGTFLLPTFGIGRGALLVFGSLRDVFILSAVASLAVLVCSAAIRYATIKTGTHIWCVVAILFSIVGLSNGSASVLLTIGLVLSLAGGIVGLVY